MYRISCFADEISPDLGEQIAFMQANGIKHVELRSVWDKNVADLTDGEIETVKAQFTAAGIALSSIGSPIGKIDIGDDFQSHFQKFRRVVHIAGVLRAPYIRIFSFFMRKEDYSIHEQTVVDRLRAMLTVAEEHDVCLLHENEARIFGEPSLNCRKLFEAMNSRHFRAVLDPSNFVAAGEDPLSSFENVKDYVEYVHVKDSLRATHEIVVAGRGDGRIRELLHALRRRDGMFLSLEPHLCAAGPFRGFTGPELFRQDLEALRAILKELEIRYE